ncbi:glucose-6-phosphate dehydrogenase [Actinospica durhamensis]|uniref:Glucose-6-phosphate 1-dehydrogenase n=1 Tax=Actinospica durhamensis TaxID=1508375 RepID=A0A941ET97_9ACTN|nr:glucose-6-phosphate dehydrogenase [Actinospica durhamensis]MBR7836798.1 glucose-6-phosphate dehydrogenase [Actinospica durhamensis]
MASTESGTAANTLVDFGITGDLAHKMTLRALYRLEKRGLLDCRIIGVAADSWTLDHLVEHAKEGIAASGEKIDDEVFGRFVKRLSYISGDVTDDSLYAKLAEELGPDARTVYYLQMPPSLFGPIVEKLGEHKLLDGARVAVEKPFGHDLDSARDLNTRLRAVLAEEQLLRVDHFLGKSPVIELEYLRFANLALAELWDRKSVSAIQITMAENFGVEDRGRFYDPVGALRDVVQNHLLQVLALVAMDPPAGAGADDLRDKKGELLRAVRAADPKNYVRGQYQGYLDVPGVAPDSDTETFAALRLEIDNWRWAGVPIYLRAGKALAERVTEVRLHLHRTPKLAFLPKGGEAERNQVVLRIDPDPGLRIALTAKADQTADWTPLTLDATFGRELGEPLEPYERLLQAALVGDAQLFAREDSVEESWRIVQPLIDSPSPLHVYERGSWGPEKAADKLGHGHVNWHQPWMPDEV